MRLAVLRFYCKSWPCVQGGENRPCSGNPAPTVLTYFTARLGQLDLRP